jgi:hypothetical protein
VNEPRKVHLRHGVGAVCDQYAVVLRFNHGAHDFSPDTICDVPAVAHGHDSLGPGKMRPYNGLNVFGDGAGLVDDDPLFMFRE